MLFFQDQYRYFATQFTGQKHYFISQFSNQEFSIKLDTQVYGQKCIVVGSLTACAEQTLQLLLLLHTLSKSGAAHVALFSPYLGYQRQDKFDREAPRGLQWADAMLHAAGVQQIITIEPHNHQAFIGLQVPVFSYSAEYIFEQEMAHFIALGFTFIFPDAGALLRYRWILEKFPTVPYGGFIKSRLCDMVSLEEFQGSVSRKVIIYDDILDSGRTLVQVCIALQQMGVEEIVIFVTHAFFNGQAWNNLWNLGVKVLYCTDSLPAAHNVDHLRVYKKTIAHFLQKSI